MPFFLCIIAELVTFVTCKKMQKSTMKKSIIFLVSALLSVGTIQAAECITKCYGQDATMTASSGDSHQWYKDGFKIIGATNQSYTAVDLKASATYTCEVTTNGTSTNTGNLITLGGFEFPAKKPTLREENKLGDWIDYQYLNFDDKGVNIGIGACTTAKNANDVKTAYFSDLNPHSGDYLLVCDGASDPDARVWSARNLKLKGGVEYQFSCWAANIDKEYALHGANSLPKLKFVIENETGKHTLLEFTASTTLGEWNEYKATYTPPKDLNWCHIYIVNYTTEPAGNDFALDDVYFGTVINSAGSTQTETFNVTVYDTFNYKFVTEPVCPGTQATITTTLVPAHGGTLEPAANYKYEWKENGKTPVVSTSKDLVVTAPNSVGTFSYVLSTSSSVCYTSGAKSQTISIDTRKSDCGTTATATKGYTPCSGTTCTLEPKSTFTTGTVTWKDASGSVITDLNISITSLTPLVYTCIIETTAANGTPHTITETHTITPQDCGKEETINHPAVTYCTNQIVTLTCDNTGSSVVWDHDPSLTDTEITVTSNSAVGETDTYKCTITTTDNGNTITYIETFTVKTKDCTTEKTETHDLSDCPKQEVTLTCTNTADATKDKIVWSHDPSLQSTTAKVKTKDTPAAEGTPNTPDTYTCTITKVNDKGETFIYTETFNVTTKDDCVGNNEEEEKITIGSTITIKSDYWDTPGADFNWYKIENGVKTPVSGDINSPGTITFTANESVTYECITTLPNGYTYTETRKVEVFNDTEEDVYICYGDDFNRTANTQNASEYKWYNTLNETEVLSSTKELEIKELKQNTSYICKIIGADGITKITETYHVKLNPLPAFNIEVKVADATINISAGTAPYNISLSDGTEATSNTSEYTFEELAENTYIVTITDKNKCVNSNEFTISIPKLTPDIFFSPNNDGVNDLWLVEGIETAPNAYIRIYDRYSKLLYQCKGADFKGWDGNYNGHGMVQDDYWYVISIPETEEQISGHFTLKR